MITIPPEQRDLELGKKLRTELPGILNWALAGCRAWVEGGLKAPSAVTSAVAEYKEDMDLLGQWLGERCELGAEFTISGAAAYCIYKNWAENAGLKPWGGPTFGRKVKERFDAKRDSSGIQYWGLREKQTVSRIVKAVPNSTPSPAGRGSDEDLLRLDRAPT